MKPHPRIRKTVKWGGAVVSVVLLIMWVVSGWWQPFCYPTPWVSVTLRHGEIFVYCDQTVDRQFFEGRRDVLAGGNSEPLRLRWSGDARLGWINIPLWIPFAVLAGSGATAWRLDTRARRRARVGFCPKCNYDRTGLAPGAVCPECGAGPASSPT